MKRSGLSGARAPVSADVSRTSRRHWLDFGLSILAFAAVVSVYIVNGVGLFYYDTAGYLDAGDSLLRALHLTAENVTAPATDAQPAPETLQPTVPAVATPDDPLDKTIVGNRSAIYGVVLAVLDSLGWLDAAVVLNVAALWLAMLLVGRLVVRTWGLAASPALISASLMLAGTTGSLPFYTAFLMPDVLAPILILMIAILATFTRRMLKWEIAVALSLALVAVLSHPSHLVIAAGLGAIAVFVTPTMDGHRNKLAIGLLVALVALGLAERLAFTRMVETTRQSEVFYLPFLTARLIDDGPGLAFLAAHCPSEAWATCTLHDHLSGPDGEGLRLDAPMILFSRDPRYGSFRLLTREAQVRVAREQTRFALAVLAERPTSVIGSIALNTFRQLQLSGINMTIPAPEAIGMLVSPAGRLDPVYADGRLTANRGWIAPLEQIHRSVYVLSAIGIAALLAVAAVGRYPGGRLASLILAGVAVNALVCGAISEPADRYGSRVMFLLPVTLALLVWARVAFRNRPLA